MSSVVHGLHSSGRPSVNADYDYDRLQPSHLAPALLTEPLTVTAVAGDAVHINCTVNRLGKNGREARCERSGGSVWTFGRLGVNLREAYQILDGLKINDENCSLVAISYRSATLYICITSPPPVKFSIYLRVRAFVVPHRCVSFSCPCYFCCISSTVCPSELIPVWFDDVY